METFVEVLVHTLLEALEDMHLLADDVSRSQCQELEALIEYELAISGRL